MTCKRFFVIACSVAISALALLRTGTVFGQAAPGPAGSPGWATASMQALETYLALREGPAPGFSEINLSTQISRAYDESYDRGPGDNGNGFMAVGYYASWRGPVLDCSDPPAGRDPARYVQGITFVPVRTSSKDNSHIKQAIKDSGAIATEMWLGAPDTFGSYFNDATRAWYCKEKPVDAQGGTHAVTIVGYDDKYSKRNFKSSPPGDGALIVKDAEGDLGSFYVSYYDATLMTASDSLVAGYSFARVDRERQYDTVYQHDLLGYNHPLTVDSKSKTVSFANAFRTTGAYGESLRAVSFYSLVEGASYEVSVVSDYSGSASLSKGTHIAKGRLALPGYYTVDLEKPVSLARNAWFAVVVKLTATTKQAIATDSMNGDSVMRSVSRPGESYVLMNGVWTDMATVQANTNVCLKAFTCDEPVPAADMMAVPDMKLEIETILDRLLSTHPVVRRDGFTAAQLDVIASVRGGVSSPLSRVDYGFQLMRILAMMGEAETLVQVPYVEKLYLDLPFQWLMDDGPVVSLTAGSLKKGDRILSLGGASPEELVRMLRTFASSENEYLIRYLAPGLLERGSYLNYLGLVNLDRTVDVEILRDGAVRVFRVPLLTSHTGHQAPPAGPNWSIETDNSLGYLRIVGLPHRDLMGPLQQEISEFFAAVREGRIENIVLDLRFVSGGWAHVLPDLLGYFGCAPIYWEGYRLYSVNRPADGVFLGNTYVLTSNAVSGASLMVAGYLHDSGVATTVGEPTGGKPAFSYSLIADERLPVTGWYFRIATRMPSRPRYLDTSEITLFPDVPAHTSREDLVAGTDAQMEKVREVITASLKVKKPAPSGSVSPGNPVAVEVPAPSQVETPLARPTSGIQPYIESFSWATKFDYFIIDFAEPIADLHIPGIKVLDPAGKSISLREVCIAAQYDDILIVRLTRSISRNEHCTVVLPSRAVTLDNGVTNAAVELSNYKYY